MRGVANRVGNAGQRFEVMNRSRDVVVTSSERIAGGSEMADKVAGLYGTWKTAIDGVAVIVRLVDRITEVLRMLLVL